MWTEALAMIDRAEQLHRRFFEPALSPIETASWQPPVDIFETDQELWLIAALPGVEPDDLDLSINGDLLRVAGLRRLPAAARTAAIRRLEIPYGRFERQVRLPSTRLAVGRSELANGCLVVSLTKRD
jgi:HSP20 family molecular chaperone IbpA